MADYDSSLPIRSEADIDERVQVKVVDATTPTQQMEVDTDKNAHVEMHGNRADNAADIVMRLSELGAPNGDGDYHADDNSKPASVGIIASDRGATIDETSQNLRPTAVAGESDSICIDMALHDEAGQAYDLANPLPVEFVDGGGDEVDDYQTSAAVASDASVTHDYTVTAAKTLFIDNIWASASGKMKVEIGVETAVASGIFTSKQVGFNSTSSPNVDMDNFKKRSQVAGAKVRITLTNLDNQAQDLYSTMIGVER